jgi:hypothetical protein
MKHLLLALTLLFSLRSATAQSNWLGAINAGDFDDDRGTALAKDDSGNVYVTGYFASPTITFGSVVLSNSSPGTYDMFIVKYRPSGTVQWAISAGGSSYDYSNSISVDTNNDIYISGNFRSATLTFGTTTLTNAGPSYDLFIAKFSSMGVSLWAKRAGGTNDETCTSVSASADGNVQITGFFTSSSITFGTTTLTNAQNSNADVFVAKYDGSGNVLWAKRAGGVNGEYGNGITTDANSNVYITGNFGSNSITFGTTTLTNANVNATMDVFVTMYDASGSVQWAKRFGGNSDDVSNSIYYNAYGYVNIGGYFASPTIDFGPGPMSNAGLYDVFIAAIDLSGNGYWSQRAGGNGFDVCNAVTSDASGNVFGTGYFDSPGITFGSTTLTNAGNNDVFAAGYTWNGNFRLAAGAGSSITDEGHAICMDSTGNVVVTGNYTSSSITFGPSVLTNLGSNDVFISTLSSTDLTTGLQEERADAFSIYPNPANGLVNLEGTAQTTTQLFRMVDMTGRTVREWEVPPFTAQASFSMEGIPSGLYFCMLNVSGWKRVEVIR